MGNKIIKRTFDPKMPHNLYGIHTCIWSKSNKRKAKFIFPPMRRGQIYKFKPIKMADFSLDDL